jgi:hypothetical protein
MQRQPTSPSDEQAQEPSQEPSQERDPVPDQERDYQRGVYGQGRSPGTRSTAPTMVQRVTMHVSLWWHATVIGVGRWMGQHPRAWRILAVGAAGAGVIAILIALQAPSARGPEQTAPDTKRFYVSSAPVLVFDHSIGSVHLLAGPDGQVSIKETDNGQTDAITVHYAQHGDTISVTVDIENGLMQDTWVDFDVSVPAHAGLTATMPTGTITATGLGGRIALSGTNGAIWATDLTGSISLTTQSGSINLTHVTGQVNATTQNGTITTTATQLEGHSTVRAEGGTINFHGTLNPHGQYLFQNTNGAVGVTLPPHSAVALSATTSSGSINTDFPGVSVTHPGSRSEAHATIGAAPRAPLTIQTAGGSIGVFQGG